MPTTINAMRAIPSVDSLLQRPRVTAALAEHARPAVLAAVREALAQARGQLRAKAGPVTVDDLENAALGLLQSRSRRGIRPVVNATGVILHTNLGRAPLSAAASAAMTIAAAGYSSLEYDLETGSRGSRDAHLDALLAEVTGAESGLAFNNNASALVLALTALASGREVIVSRGQLVEIGGGFRLPEIMRASGARLVEVGTTNRTYISDYREAIGPATALLLRVHSSNFRTIGFTHEANVSELVGLARENGLLVVDDLGSGALLDTSMFGLEREPMVQDSVQAGASLVLFSGDKLLGGPQAGLVVGCRDAIEPLRRHALARAMRCDKCTIAGLQATLLQYARAEAADSIPVWQMVATPLATLEARVKRWRRKLAGCGSFNTAALCTRSTVGGGSLPGQTLPTWAIAIEPNAGQGWDGVEHLAWWLRSQDLPVIGRLESDRLLLDPRTVVPNEDRLVVAALLGADQLSRSGVIPPLPV